MKNVKKPLSLLLALFLSFSVTACGGSSTETSVAETSDSAIKIGAPDDSTNLGRAIKLLESAGLITVDPDAGYTPELVDITGYIYNIEIVPTTANTLPATLDDFAASAINNTYAIPAGLVPSEDALILEQQDDSGDNPYVNVIVARTEDAENELYRTIVDAYQQRNVAIYTLVKYNESSLPVFDYGGDYTEEEGQAILEEVDAYQSSSEGKTVVKIGVCGSNNDTWNAVQMNLDEMDAGIYLEIITFDAYTLPNEALNSGEIDLNSFQHKAYLASEIEANGYELTAIGDTVMAPLGLYSNKVSTLEELKELAGLAAAG